MPAVAKLSFPPRQLFERAPPRLVLPCPGPELVSLRGRFAPLPSEAAAAEVPLSLQRPCVLWIALSPCRPVWPSFSSCLRLLLNSQLRPPSSAS